MLGINKKIILSITSVALSACASMHESVLNEQEKISDTAYNYIYKKAGSVDRLIFTQQKPILENNIYRFHSRTDYFEFSNEEINIFNSYLNKECKKLNGNFDGAWCVNDEKPLFYANISKREINIDEPINKDSENWKVLAKKMGFKSDSDIAQEKIEIAKNDLKSLEYIKLQYAKTLTSDIGSMVCKRDEIEPNTFYVGYIDAKEKSKIKVLVIKKGMELGNQIADIKIEQKQIWDDMKNWYVCEYNIQY
ncbi:hypothetical protein ACHCAL_05505 [Providencia huaxiensis]|uniref:hypothetical protein n=1 Tax=Providencia huaxiensis TaxID=2027290 RepID=UPI003756DFB9